MLKLAIFDLDDTLAPVGKPMSAESVKLLKQIENSGVRIAISSGKPVYYQIGMLRQVGLKEPVFIGENGSVIAFGVSLPPKYLNSVRPGKEFFYVKDKILADAYEICKDGFWLQPNEVVLTLFFKDEKAHKTLKKYFDTHKYDNIIVYEHVDSFDVLPRGVDKKSSLNELGKALNIQSDEMIAVGDGANDIPMIEYCKYSIGVGKLDKSLTTYHYDTIEEAFGKIMRMKDE